MLAACHERRVPVVPQGGNTGLVGGAVPRGGEVVLSLARLDALGPVDRATAQVEAGAGRHARRAAGARARRGPGRGRRPRRARLGDARRPGRHQRRRRRARCATGRCARGSRASRRCSPTARSIDRRSRAAQGQRRLRPAARCSSAARGRSAVVTRVRWRLVPLLPARVAALVPLGVARRGRGAARRRCGRALPSLEAAEFLLDDGLAARPATTCASRAPVAERRAGLRARRVRGARRTRPRSSPRRWARPASRTPSWPTTPPSASACGASARPTPRRSPRPACRTSSTSACRSTAWRRSPRACRAAVAGAAPGARTILFGHLGDGNVHVNVLGAAPDDDAASTRRCCGSSPRCGGTISAEHGVGVAKARWLRPVRPPGELAAMAAVKRALDPRGILNPGAVLRPADRLAPRPHARPARRGGL